MKRSPATHSLVVSVPLDLTHRKTRDFDPVQELLRVLLSAAALASLGVRCGDVTAELREV